jgi:hypothetical protein
MASPGLTEHDQPGRLGRVMVPMTWHGSAGIAPLNIGMVMIDQVTAAPYDGMVPFTVSGRPPGTVQGWARAGVTIAFVVVPFAGLAAAAWLAWATA